MYLCLEELSGKRCIAFGAGNALKGLLAVQAMPFEYIVDDTPALAGSRLGGLEIHPSARLLGEDRDRLLILICANTSSGVLAIMRRLVSMGFEPGRHFLDCSHFQVRTMAERLATHFGLNPDPGRIDRVRALSLGLRARNLSTIAGTWLFVELLDGVPQAPLGAIAECGVYQGANALVSCGVSNTLGKRPYFLYDSFEGLADFSASDPTSRVGEFADVDLKELRTVFASLQNVHLVEGRFESTLSLQPPDQHALVYVDCDLKEPTRFCCEHFWDLLVPGGFLMTHDYWYPTGAEGGPAHFTGVREAFDSFCVSRGVTPVVFPETSHAVIRKPGN